MDILTIRIVEENLKRHLSTAIMQLESANKTSGQEIKGSYRASARKEIDECQALLDGIKKEAGLK